MKEKKVKPSQNIGILMHRKGGGEAETNCQRESTDLARVGTGSVYTNENTWIEERLVRGDFTKEPLVFCKTKASRFKMVTKKKKKNWL
jgi:hypothetical protein